MPINPDALKSSEDENEAEAYHSPQLIEYGNIREITRSVGFMGMNDMGGGGINKTGF